MAKGSNTYKGLAAPLNGNFEITGESTALDIMTLTNAATTAGDFIVCQTANGTEVFVVEDDGKMTIGGGGLTVTSGDVTVTAGDIVIGDGYYLRFSSNSVATAPTTGLTLGDVILYAATNVYQLALCIDGSNTLKKIAFTHN